MILVGDVGGTKVRLALCSSERENLTLVQTEQYASRQSEDFESLVRQYLKKHTVSVDLAVFGVPGPVIEGTVQTTNLPWKILERSLIQILDIPQVKLVNDLYATTASLPYLDKENLIQLHQGSSQSIDAVKAVLAPGTGLGQGFLITRDGQHIVRASEGGHTDFAPNSQLETELLIHLRKRFGHVSYERIISGPGLYNVQDYPNYTLLNYHLLKQGLRTCVEITTSYDI